MRPYSDLDYSRDTQIHTERTFTNLIVVLYWRHRFRFLLVMMNFLNQEFWFRTVFVSITEKWRFRNYVAICGAKQFRNVGRRIRILSRVEIFEEEIYNI